jgi:hypothetical protein
MNQNQLPPHVGNAVITEESDEAAWIDVQEGLLCS